jgi:hypothetical protein
MRSFRCALDGAPLRRSSVPRYRCARCLLFGAAVSRLPKPRASVHFIAYGRAVESAAMRMARAKPARNGAQADFVEAVAQGRMHGVNELFHCRHRQLVGLAVCTTPLSTRNSSTFVRHRLACAATTVAVGGLTVFLKRKTQHGRCRARANDD